jgi:hypothetical protein
MNSDILWALRLFGLGSGATSGEVQQAYRDLALVWHPDRFLDHPRLRAHSGRQMAEINEAREILEDWLRQQPVDPEPEEVGLTPETQDAPLPEVWEPRPRHRKMPLWLVLAGTASLAASGLLLPLLQAVPEATVGESPVTLSPAVAAETHSPLPKYDSHLFVSNAGIGVAGGEEGREDDGAPSGSAGLVTTQVSTASEAPAEAAPASADDEDAAHDSDRAVPAPPEEELPSDSSRPAPTSAHLRTSGTFTIGSTEDEVLAVQGTPTRTSRNEWAYGLSTVGFTNGRVASFNNFRGNLKVEMADRR